MLSPPLWLDRDCLDPDSTRPSSQLSQAGAHILRVFTTSSLFPYLQPQATRSLSVLLNPCLAGEGAGSLPGVLHQAWRELSWGCGRTGPWAGPRDLFVLKQFPYRLFFQCPLNFLVSFLHKCWGTIGCSLCSSVDWLGVPPLCRGK